MKKLLFKGVLSLGFVGMSLPSWGQQAPTKKEDAKKQEKTAETKTPENKDPKVDFKAGDVWDVDIFNRADHKVLVIQDRKYTKAGKFEAGLHLGSFDFSPWYESYSGGGQVAYHFTEYLGLEVFGNKSTSSLSKDGKQVKEFLDESGFTSIKEFHEPNFYAGAMAVWSPIYGKFAFFRSNIIHFDIFGQMGPTYVSFDSNKTSQGGKNQNKWGLGTAVGLRVFLSKQFNLRFDIRNNIYRAYFAGESFGIGAKTLTRSAFQYNLGVSMLLGSGKVSNQEE